MSIEDRVRREEGDTGGVDDGAIRACVSNRIVSDVMSSSKAKTDHLLAEICENKSDFPSASSGQALRQSSGQNSTDEGVMSQRVLATADVIDNLIDFQGADEGVDGSEQQVRGRVGIGDEAPDLEPEQAYLTL